MTPHIPPPALAQSPPPTPPAQALGIALVYCTLAALGVAFAIPPGYASPIFPASGFAVAALLKWGRSAWWCVALGSFAMNLGHAALLGPVDARAVLVAAGIAAGAALQALLAQALVQRFTRERWRALESERDIVLCLALAGPLACLVSASVGVSVLSIAGLMALADAPYALLNWWLGDVLGVCIVLPLSLAFLYRHDPVWRTRRAAQVLPMAVVLALVGVAFYVTSDWERTQDQQALEKHGQALAQKLQQRFIAHQEALASLRRLVEVTPEMTLARFEYFTRITLKDNPDIFALSINPYVKHNERGAFERHMRSLRPDFRIRERNAQRTLVNAQDRADYVPVGFIAPLQGNAAAVGFDINSDPVRADAVARARNLGAAAITAPVQLVQENKKRPGVLVLMPAYRMDSEVHDPEASPALLGFAVGVIKVDEMMKIATRAVAVEGIHVRLEDPLAEPGKGVMFETHVDEKDKPDFYAWQGRIAVADRYWTLGVHPSDTYLQQQRHWVALLVGSTGLVLASLLQVLLMGNTGRTSVVQRIIKQQTAELQTNSHALEDRNAQLSALFTLSPDGFVAIDHSGTIRFVNPAFQRITGIHADEVVGQTEDMLNAELERRSYAPGAAPMGLPSFRTFGEGLSASTLQLRIPRNTVIQRVSVQSESPSVARIVYFRDVTAEAEVDQLKSEFLSTAAHELRTPLVSVFGFAEVLLHQEMGEADRKELLGIIHRQAGQMSGILDELLDLARMEARRGKDFVFEKVALQTLVQQAVAQCKIPEGRQPPRVHMPDTPRTIFADASKLQQALGNVLGNAYQYSPRGGDVRVEWVESGSDAGKPLVGLRISDAGIGMSEDQVQRIFERFYRGDTSGKIPGTGLGMAVVKEIVELHAGHVEVHSQPGAGTQVTLWLPATLGS